MSWFENPEQFTDKTAIAPEIYDYAGPRGVALLDVYSQGRTTGGWGMVPGNSGTFMPNYEARKFDPRRRLIAFDAKDQPFAIVMRSLALVMVDIDRHLDDGGADGFESAKELNLPVTLAETSKSGEGRHLFYSAPGGWSPTEGYAPWEDAIGIVPGVDVRVVGCCYHYPTQRWNNELIAPLPQSVIDLLEARKTRKTTQLNMLAATAAAPDTEEALIMQDALLQELAKPIPAGKRNTSLFAIGVKLKLADVPKWDEKVLDRANEIGLDISEAEKIVGNIERYGAAHAAQQGQP